jgi:hypothetical protein
VNEDEALAAAFARAGGTCECIGGGCPSLTHRPGVNRCSAGLNAIETTAFLAASRFADRSDPENIVALCTACAESPSRQSRRISAPPTPG